MKNLKPLFIFGALILPFAGNAQYTPSTDKTILYELERNEPANSGLFGVSVNPAYLDVHNLNTNIGGGLELFYSFKSRLRISGNYHIAYLDNLGGDAEDKAPYGSTWNSYGIPVKSKKSSRLGILVIPTLHSWEKEKNYHIELGSAGYRAVAVTRVRANVMKALTGRFGYQVDNRLIQSKNADLFITNTPAYVYHDQDGTHTLTPNNMAASSTMMNSNIVVIGIGYTSFRDVKISLDDEKYRGRREEKSQADLFFDILYANKLSLQDMIYYHSVGNTMDGYRNLPQRLDLSATPLTKTGFRVGYQVLKMYRPNFGSKIILEGGLRPGPKNENKDTNMYGQITFGFVFGGRIAQKEE